VVGWLDSCARLQLDRGGRFGAYFYLGLVGGVVGIGVAIGLGWSAGASPLTLAIVCAAPLMSFLLAVRLSTVVFGVERIVLYEKFAAALAGTALALHLGDQPVLAGLELMTLGVGAFLVFGRLGCLHVGCCHGRPYRRGIVYGDEHRRAGFAWYYVGVRLFPIQLLESALTLLLVIACVIGYVRPHQPGDVIAGYFLAYGVMRFVLELGRGDEDRPHLGGASEAQWIAASSAALIAGLAIYAERAWASAAIAVACVLASSIVALAVADRVGRERAWGRRQVWRVRARADELARQRMERAGQSPGRNT
jgi:prolipoprotein diacylglyceryltransferase